MLAKTLTGGFQEPAVGSPQLDVNRRPHISLQKVEITLPPSTAYSRGHIHTYHQRAYVCLGVICWLIV